MKVLVTGATGFIGANLVRRLLERGDEVRCLIRKPNICLEGLDVEQVTVPLGDRADEIAALRPALRGCEGLYHVAGLFDPSPGGSERMRRVHIYGTRGLLRAAEQEGVRRAVICSSSITVGFGPEGAPGDEDTTLDPDAIYGQSGALRDYYNTKLQEEQLSLGWSDLEVVVVNPDYIIGPWDIKPTSGKMIVTMARHWIPFYPRGGKCFQHVRDCADGHILAMDRGEPGRRYLLGNENLSYQAFMGLIAEVTGQRPPIAPLPAAAVRVAALVGEVGSGIDPHRFAGLDGRVLSSMQQPRYRSGARSHRELGVPQTPIRHAIEEAYAWFTDHGYC
ncbi:MAG: dihydroflavonol-4-reductase [Myxococcota bacterium]|jgi:dihydroflavonol-4-reductase